MCQAHGSPRKAVPGYAPDLPHFVIADAKMRLLLERVRQTAHSP